MKLYQTLIAAGLTTILSISPALGKSKDEYPTRTECNQVLNMNPGLITAQYHYCMGTGDFNSLLLLAKDPCAGEANVSLADPSMEENLKKVFMDADTEEPKYIITQGESLNYQKHQRDLCSQNDQKLENEVSASAPAQVAGSTLTENKEAKDIPAGMVGIGGYFATENGIERLNGLAGVRAGKTEFKYENGLCTLVPFNPSTQDELKALEEVLIESSPDNNSIISDENIKGLQLKMCCDNYKKENKPVACDQFKK